jgi:alkylhydroperoxidase family enzyme
VGHWSDTDAQKSARFPGQDIWDIAEIAAMYNYTNRLASATGMLPNPEYHGLAR